MAGPYYVDVTTGNDSDTGLSEALAFATLEKAADTVASGEIVYVKASADYVVQDGANDCVMQITTAGATTTPIVWQGYVSTIGDGGIVTIDANTNTLANCVKAAVGILHNVFKNFEFTGATGVGWNGSNSEDNLTFKNCRFTSSGLQGMTGDNSVSFENCCTDNNGTTTAHHGIDVDTICLAMGVVSYANGGRGMNIEGVAHMAFCLFYENGNIENVDVFGTSSVVNCTFDAENGNSSECVRQDSGTASLAVVNCIIHDANTGILTDGALSEGFIGRSNLFNSNTANVSGFLTPNIDAVGSEVGESQGDVIDTPDFTNEAGNDYTIAAAGNPIAAGFDAKFVVDFWDSFIAAVNPPTP